MYFCIGVGLDKHRLRLHRARLGCTNSILDNGLIATLSLFIGFFVLYYTCDHPLFNDQRLLQIAELRVIL
jgi:hypothetical protein